MPRGKKAGESYRSVPKRQRKLRWSRSRVDRLEEQISESGDPAKRGLLKMQVSRMRGRARKRKKRGR